MGEGGYGRRFGGKVGGVVGKWCACCWDAACWWGEWDLDACSLIARVAVVIGSRVEYVYACFLQVHSSLFEIVTLLIVLQLILSPMSSIHPSNPPIMRSYHHTCMHHI